MLRGISLTLLLLLLFNPALPSSRRATGTAGTVVVLDASLSMEMRDGAQTRWEQAVAAARRVPNAKGLILMGGAGRLIPLDSLASAAPVYAESRLLPALQAAAEGGAEKVVVITDGGIEDEMEVRRWLPRLGVEIETQTIGAPPAADRALVELETPAWAEAGKPVEVRLGVGATSGSGEGIRVSVRSADASVANTIIAQPQPGRIGTGTVSFTPAAPEGGGLVRYDVVIEGTDPVESNNRRSFYLFVGEKPAGVALVSLVPDWEPRFLHPVLAQSLGLPVRSFLRATGTTFITGGPATEAGKRVTEEAVRAAVADADLFVLHGAGPELPAWVTAALGSKTRVLVLPHESGIELPSLSLSGATPGDWFIAEDVPPSPVAGGLAGLPAASLTPLLAVHLAREMPSAAWTPLVATRGRRGAQTPIAMGLAEGGRRTVVAMGTGFWRWAFRGGEQKQVYARFWGALAGWLIQEQTQIAGGAVRPAQRVVERGRAVGWTVSGIAADSLRLRVNSATGIVADTTIPLEQADSAFSRVLPPGHYQYTATALAGGREVGQGSGPLTVDAYSSEFARTPRRLDDLSAAAQAGVQAASGAGARPLRTSLWPFLLLTALLATEWVLRRRWGLR